MGGMGVVVGERLKRERIYVHLWLIHIAETTQHYKAIILQLKKCHNAFKAGFKTFFMEKKKPIKY